MSESKEGIPKSEITKTRMSEGRRRLFTNSHNPLGPGEIYISWISRAGGRRHAIAIEEGTMEFSRDGGHWFQVTNLTESMDKAIEHSEGSSPSL